MPDPTVRAMLVAKVDELVAMTRSSCGPAPRSLDEGEP